MMIVYLCRWFVGAILIVAAVAKIAGFANIMRTMSEVLRSSRRTASRASVGLVAAEAAVGAWAFTDLNPVGAMWAATSMFAVFAVFLAATLRGHIAASSCNCFGVNAPLTLRAVGRNVALAALAIAGTGWQVTALVTLAATCMFASVAFSRAIVSSRTTDPHPEHAA
jgi:hypothetical protein